MNILIVSQEFPYPPHFSGAKLKLYYLIKYLSQRHKIYLISLTESEAELKYIDEMKRFCEDVYSFGHRSSPSLTVAAVFKQIFSRYPYEAQDYYSDEVAARIKEAIAKYKIDIVHFDLIYMAQYGECVGRLPKVIAVNDVNWLLWRDIAKYEKKVIPKIKAFFHYLRIKEFESSHYPRFDRCVVVSPRDRDELKAYFPEHKLVVIPNGVDIDKFHFIGGNPDSHNLIFTGVMSYKPNTDAMIFFCGRILPLIKERVPDVKLYIVGRDPSPEINGLKSDNVIITGYVDSIIDYAKNASVYVAPLRMGSGIKNKVLEAMAMGLPVVATTLSVEAIEAVSGKEFLVGDNPEDFAKAVVGLLNNSEKRIKLTENARRTIEEKYNWNTVVARYENLYESLLK